MAILIGEVEKLKSEIVVLKEENELKMGNIKKDQ